MDRDEIIQCLKANVEQTVEITYTDDVSKCLTIVMNVDDEGFVHNLDGELYLTTFDDVAAVHRA